MLLLRDIDGVNSKRSITDQDFAWAWECERRWLDFYPRAVRKTVGSFVFHNENHNV